MLVVIPVCLATYFIGAGIVVEPFPPERSMIDPRLDYFDDLAFCINNKKPDTAPCAVLGELFYDSFELVLYLFWNT